MPNWGGGGDNAANDLILRDNATYFSRLGRLALDNSLGGGSGRSTPFPFQDSAQINIDWTCS